MKKKNDKKLFDYFLSLIIDNYTTPTITIPNTIVSPITTTPSTTITTTSLATFLDTESILKSMRIFERSI